MKLPDRVTLNEWATRLNELDDQLEQIQAQKKEVYTSIRGVGGASLAEAIKKVMRLKRMKIETRMKTEELDQLVLKLLERLNTGAGPDIDHEPSAANQNTSIWPTLTPSDDMIRDDKTTPLASAASADDPATVECETTSDMSASGEIIGAALLHKEAATVEVDVQSSPDEKEEFIEAPDFSDDDLEIKELVYPDAA